MENRIKKEERFSLGMKLMVVLWPGFLMACVGTGIFFSLVDPMELIIFDEKIQVHMLGAYTIGFLMFWALGCLSSWITTFLLQKIR